MTQFTSTNFITISRYTTSLKYVNLRRRQNHHKSVPSVRSKGININIVSVIACFSVLDIESDSEKLLLNIIIKVL